MLSLQATILNHQPGDPYESPNENEDFIWMTYWMDNAVWYTNF